MSFAQQVADTEFDKLDEEFRAIGQRAGYDPLPAAEVIGIQEGKRVASPKPHGYRGPVARGGQPQMGPAPVGFQRPQPVRPPHWQEEAERQAEEAKTQAAQRTTYRVVRKPTPITIEVERDDDPDQVDEYTVYLQRIPSTQIPYLDRLEQIVESTRLRMARIPGKDAKELREIDKLAAEYNATMQEFIRYSVQMPDGLYERLDNVILGELQDAIRRQVMNARIQQGSGLGAGN